MLLHSRTCWFFARPTAVTNYSPTFKCLLGLFLYLCNFTHAQHMTIKIIHTSVDYLMNPIKTLVQALAPFMWNGIIVGNSACNDLPFIWREWAMCSHCYTLSNKTCTDFVQTIDFREKFHWLWLFVCLYIACLGCTRRRQQGRRSYRSPRWQSEFLTCIWYLCAIY